MDKRIHGTSPVERSTSCKPSSLERLRSDPEFPGAMELKVSGDTGFVIEELSRQHAVDEQRELARSGGDGFGFSDAGLTGGGKRPRVRLKFYPRSSRSGAGWPRPVGRRRSPGAEPASSGDFVVGGEAWSWRRSGIRWPAAHVGAVLGDDLQRVCGRADNLFGPFSAAALSQRQL